VQIPLSYNACTVREEGVAGANRRRRSFKSYMAGQPVIAGVD